MNNILEAIEKLANEVGATADQERDKLLRLIRAEARILAGREPERFRRRPTEKRDEAGAWSEQYPPDIEYCNFTGPRLLTLIASREEDVPTSTGFYYEWRRVTVDPGLYLGRDGFLYGSFEEGTGCFGRFNAHPGNCNVEIKIEWRQLAESELELDQLRAAEKVLRVLAFPTAATLAAVNEG